MAQVNCLEGRIRVESAEEPSQAGKVLRTVVLTQSLDFIGGQCSHGPRMLLRSVALATSFADHDASLHSPSASCLSRGTLHHAPLQGTDFRWAGW